MPTEHYIAGKDASLESTIDRMQRRLAEIGFHVIERSWLNPVEGIWSVHVSDRDCPLLFTNGKGSSKLAAHASALGEFFERLACNYFWAHCFLGRKYAVRRFTHYPQECWFLPDDDDNWPEALLTPELHALYNPDGDIGAEALADHNSGNAERGICALPFTCLGDERTVWFPINVIGNLYVSNGMAAGNTLAEARAQALSEIVERHIKFRIISEGLCLPDVPEEVVARYPRIADGVRELREAGYGVLVKDASLGGQYPLMNVTLLNPKDQGCFSSFGAHPRFEVALERALTGLLQGRALDALDGFPEPGFDLDEIAGAPNVETHFIDSSGIVSWSFLGDAPDYEFCDWNFSATTNEDYAWLADLIQEEGYDIYVADYTHLGVYACRIIVPGLSEIYPIDDLAYENDSVGNDIREAVLYLPDLDDDECEALLDTLKESTLADARSVAAVIGLAPDAGSFWEDLRVGELKTLLALATGNEEAAREGCDWIRHFGQINAERRRVYRCVESLIKLGDSGDYEPYRAVLASLYGGAALQRAENLLARRERFFDIPMPGIELDGCEMHHRLLAAYDKVYRLHLQRSEKT
ncbi:MAG: 30S ribosomal protein S12 methylthiotransferase accessory factor YcaO [Propionivibrio sp.]